MYDQPPKYLVPIHGARLMSTAGLVVLPDGTLAIESVYAPEVLEREPSLYGALRQPTVSKPGDYFSLLVVWSRAGNYYHWLHDTLLRLFATIESLPPDVNFIVPADITDAQREWLRIVGVEDDRLVPFVGDEVWELETLHFAPPTTHSGHDLPEADQWLRDRTLAWYGIPPAVAERRLFISRRHAPRRRIVNEDAVEDYLRGYGFETCTAEDLAVRDQVALFAQAEAIVAPHGAGLTNMLFARPGLRVVDMIEPGMLSQGFIFWSMAEALGHEYWYFLAESVPRAGNQNDTVVPLDKLAMTLERMELTRRPTTLR